VTLSHLKRTVSIETVLNAEGLVTSLKRRGQRLVGLVPCISRIVLMLDGDDAGRSASQKIANALTQHAGIRVGRIELPQGLDPDDLTHRLHPFFS
jgi:DNA primase